MWVFLVASNFKIGTRFPVTGSVSVFERLLEGRRSKNASLLSSFYHLVLVKCFAVSFCLRLSPSLLGTIFSTCGYPHNVN